MSTNLIDLFKNSTGEILVRQTSVFLGESAQNISSSLESIIPALLGMVIMKANTEAGARELVQYISVNDLDNQSLNDAVLLESEHSFQNLVIKGSDALKYLAGDKLNVLTDWISGASALKTSSSNSLLKAVSILLLRFIARIKSERAFKATDLKDLLISQSTDVKQSTPAALGDLLEFSFLVVPRIRMSDNLPREIDLHYMEGSSGKLNYLPWLILLLASLGLFYFLQHGFNSKMSSGTGTDTGISGDSIAYQLKNGEKIVAAPNSFSATMLEYINGNDPAGKCMTLDQFAFETGSDKISVQSFNQLSELKEILIGSPATNIVITAYSDHNGDDESKQQLSDQRAMAVKLWLMLNKVPADQIQTKGMGEAKPVSSDKDEANLEMKKIVEVCVVKKR